MSSVSPVLETAPAIDPRYACFKLHIRPSPIHRWGVYAGEFIPKGRKIIEYTGEKISRRETKCRAERPLHYLFTLDSYWTLDGDVGGSGAQYINHSCEPNCWAWNFKGHILYMAARDIRPSEELTIDYNFEARVDEVPCSCRTLRCRGTINVQKPGKQAAAHKPRVRRVKED